MSGSVTIRYALVHDSVPLARLAELDSAKAPLDPVLLAEAAGELVAAISLADGAVVANPFRPTADVVELLRARERQLRGGFQRSRRRAPLARRLLRALALG
jgi:hypothetical protein